MMTPQQCAEKIRKQAAAAGLTPAQYADRINHASREDIATAMESLPTDALEWGVRFEALSHKRIWRDHSAKAQKT